MKCNQCGNDKLIGIFVNGTGFYTTDGELCGVFGCPKCQTVQFTTDEDYIRKRKEEYKSRMKEGNK